MPVKILDHRSNLLFCWESIGPVFLPMTQGQEMGSAGMCSSFLVCWAGRGKSTCQENSDWPPDSCPAVSKLETSVFRQSPLCRDQWLPFCCVATILGTSVGFRALEPMRGCCLVLALSVTVLHWPILSYLVPIGAVITKQLPLHSFGARGPFPWGKGEVDCQLLFCQQRLEDLHIQLCGLTQKIGSGSRGHHQSLHFTSPLLHPLHT